MKKMTSLFSFPFFVRVDMTSQSMVDGHCSQRFKLEKSSPATNQMMYYCMSVYDKYDLQIATVHGSIQ